MFSFTTGQTDALAIGLALAWLAGVRVYLTVFGLGLAAVLGWVVLPATLHAASAPWAICAFALLALVEFVADKIPGLDSGWDLFHTLVRIPAGAVLAAAMLSQDQHLGGQALLAGALAASCSHSIKSTARRLINTSPEPLSNWSASLAEDIVCMLALAVLFAHPWPGLGIAVGGLLLIGSATAFAFRAAPHSGSRNRIEATA